MEFGEVSFGQSIYRYGETVGWAMDKARVAAYWVSQAQYLAATHVSDLYLPSQQLRDEAMWRTLIQDYDEATFPASNGIVDSVAEIHSTLKALVVGEGEQSDSMKLFNRVMNLPTKERFRPARKVASYLQETSFISKFAVTEKGYKALVPPKTAPGDRICVLEGFPVPFVLRPVGQDYVFWGDAYFHGFMDGEALKGEAEWLTIQ
jgi:hypothetical protein